MIAHGTTTHPVGVECEFCSKVKAEMKTKPTKIGVCGMCGQPLAPDHACSRYAEPAKTEDWVEGFDNIYNSEGYDCLGGNGRARLKAFIRQVRQQAVEEAIP